MVWSLRRCIVPVLLAELVVGEDTEVVVIEQRFRLQGVSGNDALDFRAELGYRTRRGV